MELLSDYMPEPEPSDVTMMDIIDFYYRFGDKKMTAERFCITIKELNAMLKDAKKMAGENDKYTEVGMSRSDF